MRSLILMTAAMVMFGCNSTFAQVGFTTRTAPAVRTTSPATSATAVPITTTSAAALGSINTGPLGRTSRGTVGTITACPTAGAAPSVFIDASTADPIYGTLPPTPLPGATVPAAPPFGPSIMAGTCDPTASTL